MYWVNGEVFEKVGMDVPPEIWDIQTFENIGKEFVKRANPAGERQMVYFAPDLNRFALARSMGVTTYNETLTDVNYDDPLFIAAYKLMYKWTHEDHLFPTAAERESFSSASGYGGVNMQLFNAGRFALLESGRYALIQLREFNKTRREKGEPLLKLSVSRLPYEHFPVTQASTRCAGNYAGSPNKHLSKLFLAYLASEDYNMQIVSDADSLPPNPKYTTIREFTHPADYPEEWGVHEPFAKTMLEIAIPSDHGPFIVPATVESDRNQLLSVHLEQRATPEVATADAVKEIRDEIARTLREDPKLVPLYEEAKATQKKIEEYRAQGKLVPLSWIKNPFYRKYYQFKGWAAVNE
ncbi:MAG: hypothetical protein HC898_03870 [Phycisphaerales bacterium]|nr:hypothetical protein [Phycisphaerales bacterium]